MILTITIRMVNDQWITLKMVLAVMILRFPAITQRLLLKYQLLKNISCPHEECITNYSSWNHECLCKAINDPRSKRSYEECYEEQFK